MNTFAKKCFEKLHETSPEILSSALVKSKIGIEDIENFEYIIGYSLPKDFQEFLMSYVFPNDTFLVGEFWMYDWIGGWMSYSKEKKEYIYDVPEEQETTFIAFILNRLWDLSNEPGETFVKKMLEGETCRGLLKAGYIELGTFSDCYVLINLKNAAVIYVNHDFYFPEITCESDLKEMEENFEILFKNFHSLLQCLFLGEVCDPRTGEVSKKN